MSPLLPSLVTLVFVAGAYLCRRLAPKAHFFHTDGGALLLAALTALCDAGGQYVAGSGLHAEGLAQALIGAMLSLLATSNPSMSAPSDIKPPNLVSAFLPFLIASTLLASCAHVPPSYAAYGKAYGACMEQKGLSAGISAGGQAFAILDAGSGDVLSQLEKMFEAAGEQAVKDAIECAVQAWSGAHPLSTGDGGAPQASSSQVAARVFLARRLLGM
jgi:hypothetical protein